VPHRRSTHIHIRDDVIDERYHIDHDAFNAIGRMAGHNYVRIHDRFEVKDGFDAKIFEEIDRELRAGIPAPAAR